MDRQTLRDWVHRFNAAGPDGLKDIPSKGHLPRLSPEQLATLGEIVETGPDRARDGEDTCPWLPPTDLHVHGAGTTYGHIHSSPVFWKGPDRSRM
jgi:transposase